MMRRFAVVLLIGAQNHDLEAAGQAWSLFRNKRAP
jgi:hypothetical protein